MKFWLPFLLLISLLACNQPPATQTAETSATETVAETSGFKYQADRFADLEVLRYQVPGFEELTPKQKELLYYLSEAALSGRDLIWAQNYKYNLVVRHTIDGIMNHFSGDRNSENYKKFTVYAKRVWFSNGIHHHYSTNKMIPDFPEEYLAELIENSEGASFPLAEGQDQAAFIAELTPIMFDPNVAPKRVSLAAGVDLLEASATNNYDGVTQPEAEAFYAKMIDKKDPTPISHGLNSQLAKENGKVVERVKKVGGLYSEAIEKVVYWLEKAVRVAETDAQRKSLSLLVEYYKTGDLRKFDEHSIAWVSDTESRVDVINGFIETYGDPLSRRGAYESVVSIKDLEATKRISAIGSQAQWFEDHSPIMDEHKKKEVKGISAKVITVVMESGDASPSTPIGINLPNPNWIRANHGSKSVNLGNIVHSINEASSSGGSLEEFAWSEEEIARGRKYSALGSDLHTDMHEVIGHASGRINDGVDEPKATLKNYASTLEEARADLVALYYLMDPKLIEIGVMDSLDCGKSEYDGYIRNGLMQQLKRLKPGEDLEEAHMRNRQLVAGWAFEKGKAENVVERKQRDGKTYFVINDYEKLRELWGQLLREIQRIKSEGDFAAGRDLIETYGVKVDHELHEEVLARYAKLNVAPYNGFINPKLTPVEKDGKIVDVKISFPDDFQKQMLEYDADYSFIPARHK